jgi:hypothetical protein
MGKERCNVAHCPLVQKSEPTDRQTPLQVFITVALVLRGSYPISQLVGDFRYIRERSSGAIECIGCKQRTAVRISE